MKPYQAQSGCLLLNLAIGALSLGLPLASQAQGPLASRQIERVVITAERRSRALDTTPASVTALDGSRFAEQGATSLAEVLDVVPNTSVTVGLTAPQIFMRGIGNVFQLAGGDPGVALYADGIYLSDQTSINYANFDTQRVEVLRGPQGALYGRNATGGAINLVSARPTHDFQARLGIEAGNHGRKQADGFISGPFKGTATTGRLAFQVRDFDGYTRNRLAGTPPGPLYPGGRIFTPPDRLDDLRSSALRLQTATRLPGEASLRLIAGYYHQNDNGPGTPVLIDSLMNSSLLYGVFPETDPRRQASQGSINRIDVRALQAVYERPLGSATMSLTAAWRKSGSLHHWDGEVTAAPVSEPRNETASIDRSVDLHIASSDKARLQWLAGVTAQDFQQRQDIDIAVQVPAGFLVPGQPLTTALPGGFRVQLGGTIRSRSAAAYSDLRYALTPSLALMGGLRLNRDVKSADEYQSVTAPALGLAGRRSGSPGDGWTSLSGSAGIEYKVSPDTLAYARLSHGFKSGAVNLGALQGSLAAPETVAAAELGVKTRFMERRGAFNIAVFGSKYKDMQVSQSGFANTVLANASKARINGAELELLMRPVPALLLRSTLGLMDPSYRDFINTDIRNAPGRAVNLAGKQLAQVSKRQFSLGAQYKFNVGDYQASVGGDYVRRSKLYFTEFNTPDAMQDGYGMLKLTGSIQPAAGDWKLYGYVRNATDTRALTGMIVTTPFLAFARQVAYTPPRQFGIGLKVDF